MRTRSRTPQSVWVLCLALALVVVDGIGTDGVGDFTAVFHGARSSRGGHTARKLAAPVDDAQALQHEIMHTEIPSQPSNAGNFAPDCDLDALHRAILYDGDTQVWKIDEDSWENIHQMLYLVFDCAVDGDSVLFQPGIVFQPGQKSVIKAKITIGALIEDETAEDIPKAILTCPSGTEGIFTIQTAGVAFNNLVIQDCELTKDTPITFDACAETAANGGVAFSNVEFLRNSHTLSSPAIEVAAPSCYQLTLDTVRFEQNSCEQSKKAVVEILEGASITARKIEATENSCTVLMASNSPLTVTESKFLNNEGIHNSDGAAGGIGTAIRLLSEADGVVEDSVFEGNSASYGGSISVSLGAKLTGRGLEFRKNSAVDGGAIHVKEARAKLQDCSFYENTAENLGGGIVSLEGADLDLQDLHFEGNRAASGGGLTQEDGSSKLKTATFLQNVATDHGGGIHATGESTVEASLLTMTKQEARIGAAIHFEGATATITESSFEENVANKDGGALYLVETTLDGSGWTIKSNKAENGGGIALFQESHLTLSDAALIENLASASGGGALVSSQSTIDGTNLEILSNTATMGGGIAINEDSEASLRDTRLEGNSGTRAGGGLCIVAASFKGFPGVTFVNNNGAYGAGFFAQQGSIEMTEVVFSSNVVSAGGGAVLLNKHTQLTADHLTFDGNTAGGDGGGIAMLEKCTATVTESSFERNSADRKGGAMYIDDSTLVGDTLKIIHNDAAAGAGIYLDIAISVTITDSQLKANIAESEGGAIYGGRSPLMASGLTVEENEAELGGAGASFNEESKVQIESSTFVKNKVSGPGSGGAILSRSSEITCAHLELSENEAFYGGALRIELGTTSLQNISVSANSAVADGGGVFADEASLSTSDLTLDGNTAGGRGGGIFANSEDTFSLAKCTLKSNTARSTGGALHVVSPDFVAEGLTIADNSATSGGGIFVEGDASTLKSSHFERNTAEKEGGAFFASESTVVVSGLLIKDNQAANGAGMLVRQSDRIDLKQTELTNNTAGKYGGALWAESVKSLSVDDLDVTQNSAETGSGLYVLRSDKISVVNSRFTANKAVENGAAVYVLLSDKITIEDVTVQSNEASYGAGYFFENVDCDLVSNTFSDNVALKHGGAVNAVAVRRFKATSAGVSKNRAAFGGGFYLQETHAELEDCTFSANKADDAGGAINGIISSTITGNVLTFEKNEAIFGGAIYGSEVEIELTDSTLVENTAEYDGGALTVTSESSFVGNSLSFERNTATNGGAIVLQFRSSCTLETTTLSRNAATESGGAVFAMLTEHVSWTSVTLADNTARSHGGAVYLKDVFDATFQDVHFSRNTAGDGGAVYAEADSLVDASECTFEANQAEREGGAVRLMTSTLLGRSTQFKKNVAGQGGAVYMIREAALKVDGARFEENTAKSRGGALHVSSIDTETNCQIEQTAFYKNRARYGAAMHYERSADQAKDCEESFSGVCHGIELWKTEFTENQASLAGAIASLSDPYGFRFSCERRSATDSMGSLKPLVRREAQKSEVYCSNWRDNTVPHLTLANEEFSSHARDVIVNVVYEKANGVSNEHITHETVVLDRVLSGLPLPSMNLKSVDAFGNELDPATEDQFWAKLVAPEGFFRHGTEMGIQLIDGQEVFAGITCDPEPGVYSLSLLYGNSAISGTIPIEVHVSGCPPGQTMALDHTCHLCGPREFSRGGKCMLCPDGSECHGQYIVPNEGRWHKTPCQPHTQECLVKEACNAADRAQKMEDFASEQDTCDFSDNQLSEYEDILCKEGYGSALCGSCEGNHGPLSHWKCVKCLPLLWNVVLYVSVVIWLAVLACIQIRRHAPTRLATCLSIGEPGDPRVALLESRGDAAQSEVPRQANGGQTHLGDYPAEIYEDEVENSPGAGARIEPSPPTQPNATIEINRFAELAKVLMNYLQLSAVLSSLNVQWVSSIKRTFEIAESLGGVVTLVTSYASDCVLSRYWSLTRPVLRFVSALCTPLIVSLFMVVVWALYNAASKRAFTAFSNFLLLILVTVAYVCYLGVTKMAVQMFYCVSVYDSTDYNSDEQTEVLAFDTSVECYQGVHWTLIGISCAVLVLMTVGFPLIAVLRIKYRVKAGGTRASSVGNTLGFLFWPFQRKLYYWEVFVFARKAILAAICVFSRSLGGNQQQVMAVVALIAFLYLQVSFNPYSELFSELNFFESSSLFLSTVSVALGMIFGDEDPADHARVIVALVLAFCNILYLCAFGVSFIRTGMRLKAAREKRAL